MASGTLDDRYLTWLYGQVEEVKTRKSSRTFWHLFRHLFSTEFVWFIPNDDNRAEDGRELRNEWVHQVDVDIDPDWLSLGCSFLEMLIGLSRRLAFETDRETSVWFWHLINNLELLGFHDRSNFNPKDVEDITSTVIWRTYNSNGDGGLFPLRQTDNDQRKVEMWYQISEYLLQDS